MCLADTSVRGKKWQMALFQAESNKSPLEKVFFLKKMCATQVLPTGVKSGKCLFFKWVQRIIRVFGIRQKKVGKAKPFRLKYSVIKFYSENFALRNSRLRRAMWSMEIPLGHSISQARVLVQLPKPSSSIFATIFLALLAASGRP